MQVTTTLEDPPRHAAAIPDYPTFLACRYFGSLDIFRFLAILAVLWHHTEEGVGWIPATTRGFLGVDLFFVISGFLIVTLLLRERARNGSISLRQFYLRRSLRIFPIYYAMLGGLAAFFLFVRPGSIMARSFFETLPFHAFYLSNFIDNTGSILFFTWSLSTEEQFYVVWPPIERWCRRFVVPILLGVIVVNQLVNFGLFGSLLEPYRGLYITQITFTPICFGVLLAHLLNDPKWFARIAWSLGRWWSPIALIPAVLLACNVAPVDLSGWPRLLIQTMMTLLLASCVIREDNALSRVLGFRPIRRIGVISYGMYLYHEFAAHVGRIIVSRIGFSRPPTTFVVTLLITIVAAELSYRFYETPFLKLKDRLSRR